MRFRLTPVGATHILQDYFIGIGAIMRLSQGQWRNPKKMGTKSHESTKAWRDRRRNGKHNKIVARYYMTYGSIHSTTMESTTKMQACFMWSIVILSIIAPCPHGYFTHAQNYRCYTYSYRYNYTWTDAGDFCQTLGGHLLALETKKEFKEFKDWYRTGNVTVLKI